VTKNKSAPEAWEQLRQRISTVPGVERAALNEWSWNDGISVNGAPPGDTLAYFLSVSPGWAEHMKIDFIEGADFRPTDTYPGTAIVNQAFAKMFFHGQNPVGKSAGATSGFGSLSALGLPTLFSSSGRSSHHGAGWIGSGNPTQLLGSKTQRVFVVRRHQYRSKDTGFPILTILSALVPVLRAIQTDPASMLRVE
jgi:hypothetical protein